MKEIRTTEKLIVTVPPLEHSKEKKPIQICLERGQVYS